jgi:hypothetical protein
VALRKLPEKKFEKKNFLAEKIFFWAVVLIRPSTQSLPKGSDRHQKTVLLKLLETASGKLPK